MKQFYWGDFARRMGALANFGYFSDESDFSGLDRVRLKLVARLRDQPLTMRVEESERFKVIAQEARARVTVHPIFIGPLRFNRC
jgi:hypothetical protein